MCSPSVARDDETAVGRRRPAEPRIGISRDALSSERADEAALLERTPNRAATPADRPRSDAAHNMEEQIIVIGGGLAGLSAAHTVLEHGGRVLLLDKCPFLGGNSTKATSGINGALTRTQAAKGIQDSADKFEADIVKGAAGVGHTQPPAHTVPLAKVRRPPANRRAFTRYLPSRFAAGSRADPPP